MTVGTEPAVPLTFGESAATLRGLGWTQREADWLALVCLHSGVFTRSQYQARCSVSKQTASRFVRALFAGMLEETLRRYQNRAIAAAQVIEELIELARNMREAGARGEELGLTDDELAFYDALETNDSAVKVLGDETLREIARELVAKVRNNVTIDWALRENVRAKLRVLVKRTLRKHGYPPDKREKATKTVLEQAEHLSAAWAAAV